MEFDWHVDKICWTCSNKKWNCNALLNVKSKYFSWNSQLLGSCYLPCCSLLFSLSCSYSPTLTRQLFRQVCKNRDELRLTMEFVFLARQSKQWREVLWNLAAAQLQLRAVSELRNVVGTRHREFYVSQKTLKR